MPTEGLTINIDTVTTLSWKGIGDIMMGKIKNKNCDFTRSNINVYMEVIGPSRVHFATNKMILTKINLDKHIMCTTLRGVWFSLEINEKNSWPSKASTKIFAFKYIPNHIIWNFTLVVKKMTFLLKQSVFLFVQRGLSILLLKSKQ